MRSDKSNPTNNQLPPGLDETGFLDAIELSGYPLQGLVAQVLTSDSEFGVTEEWGFIDRDTQEHRALDLFAFKRFGDKLEQAVQPSIILLIECKRSRHPYIFFKSVVRKPIPRFPRVAGLPYNVVRIEESGRNRLSEVSGARALGIDLLEFVEPGPPQCAAFTKGQG